ncbi:MAG: 5-methylcytosine-specific restriction endonuclease system specificity protein McrC [Tissierellia bacterium]|nr:5-methylcytosine-specific restriction endonuclease system specificity protein McrC [Tissierellia bacterium]
MAESTILIKNIYYMLTYAFKVLKQTNYEEIATEEFNNIEDLFAEILFKGISQQLKQGLYREYIDKNENITTLRGKLDINKTIGNKIKRNHKLGCELDELSVNNIFNQIIKTTSMLLLSSKAVDSERKKGLKKVIMFFNAIDTIEPKDIQWSKLKYHRNNKSYEMLLNICFFVLDGYIQTEKKGKYKMKGFTDEHLHGLFERFVLEYFKQEHPYLNTRSSKIKWNLLGEEEKNNKFLPNMNTDIMIKNKDKTLIIDTKYYNKTMQKYLGKVSLHSSHLYQIFSYVKNYDVNNSGNVSGLLLYAKTDEEITPDFQYNMGGNIIASMTLDLNRDFKLIAKDLDNIIEKYFKIPDLIENV